MHSCTYHAAEPLVAARPFVRRILYCDWPDPVALDLPAPPTGYNHVGWAMRGSGAKVTEEGTMPVAEGEVHLAGQTVRTAARVLLYGRVRHILAELTPIGLFAAFGMEALPLVNRVVSVSDAGWGQLQATLSRVSPDAPMDEAIETFQRALVTEFAGAVVPYYVAMAAGAIEESQGLVPVHDLAPGVSDRQLRNGFKRVVGCSPKYFSQLLRVNATLVSLLERQDESLAEVAVHHGYADQSHMVRSIRTFFGHAPSEIRRNVDMLLRAFPTSGVAGTGPTRLEVPLAEAADAGPPPRR